MRAKSIFLVFVAGASVVAFVSAIRDRRARLEAADAAAQNALRRSELDLRMRESQQRVTSAEDERQRVQAALDEARKKTVVTKSEPPPRKTGSTAAPMTALRNAILNDPKMQNLQLAVVQSKMQGTYGPLCAQLRLSDAQVAQFLANVKKRTEQEMDVSAIQETQKLLADDPVIGKMRQQMSDEFLAAQRTLLGEAGLREFETYNRSVPAREFVNEFAGASVILGASVTGAQADALTEIMANASSSYRQGRTATRNAGDINWDEVLAGAARTLSEPQFAVFKNAVIQSRNMDRIRQLARRN
jgi:hypothetical protein